MENTTTWQNKTIATGFLPSLNFTMKNLRAKKKSNMAFLIEILRRIAWATVIVLCLALLGDLFFNYGKVTIDLIYWASGLLSGLSISPFNH